MHRRLLAITLILAAIVQGPTLTYAATLGAGLAGAVSHDCGERAPAAGDGCQGCCLDAAMLSCAAQCQVPVMSAVLPAISPTTRTAGRGVIVPDPGIGPFADHKSPHPLRPPIL
jgi:hypothetical protein